MGTFKSGYPEIILELLNNFDKAVFKTGTTSTVENVAFTWNLLRRKALRKYKVPL